MPLPTPFHPRTVDLSQSMAWKEWAGYYAPTCFEVVHDGEYAAIRHSAGLLDVSPLQKYDVRGPDALRFLDNLVTRSLEKLKIGQVAYTPWCDAEGKTLDDGTITRMGEDRYRLTAADPCYLWLEQCSEGMNVTLEDVSDEIAGLALQGPTSRNILKQVVEKVDLEKLRFFRAAPGVIAGREVLVSRTGYTGDLGYELFMAKGDALVVWDALMDKGGDFGITPIGLFALDLARLEAGFILKGVEYYGAKHAQIPARKYTPFELGLDWTVNMKKPRFIGKEALAEQLQKGVPRKLMGLEVHWDAIERLYDKRGLPPEMPCTAWRTAVPLYSGWKWIGKATSGCWSRILKKNIALISVESAYAVPGTEISFEWTVEGHREHVPATVVKTPFYDPERKKA